MQRYFIHQEDEQGCGLAALKMLLATYHRDEAYLYEEITTPVHDFFTMVKLAQERGVELSGYDTGEDKAQVLKNKKPFIAQLLIGEEYHFVVVKIIAPFLVQIADPKAGMILLRKKHFLALFTGKFLIAEGQVKRKKKMKINGPQVPKKYYFAWVLSLLGVTALLMAFYYVEDGVSIYRPLIFLSLALVFGFLEHLYVLGVMKEFQARHLDSKIPDLRKPYRESFYHLFNFKKNIFYRKQRFFVMIITVLIISFLLVINGINHLLAFIFIIVLAMIYDLLQQHFRGQEYFIRASESKMLAGFNKPDLNHVHKHYSALNLCTNRLVEKKVISDFTMEIILFALAFLIMSISHIAALNYLLFHFFIYRHLFKEMLTLVASPNENSLYVDDYLAYRRAFQAKE